VYFYFPRENIDLYNQDESRGYEIKEGSQFATAMELIKAYLDGPRRNDLYSPFPDKGEVLGCSISGSRIRITLSSHFNQLIGLHMTMATSCLALTMLSTQDFTVVELNILAEDGTVARSFSLSRDNIVLNDPYVALPAE
jgi:hypothetical protein